MTQSTDQERAEFEDGAWYLVEKEGWHDEPQEIAPAMYRSNSKAWYSYRFGGVPTRELKILEPCLMQAARRDPAVPQCPFPCGWKNLHKLVVAEGAFLAKSLNECEPITTHQRDVVMRVIHYGIEMARSMLAATPQPPEAAPVELPEPVAKVEDGGLKWHIPDSGYSLPVRYLQGTHKLYTEQQVRELLANQGIQEKQG